MKKNKHGGKRPGAGRKPVKAKTMPRNIYMPASYWKRLDSIRGDSSRGAWVMGKIDDT
jgi:hypothetical protein